jgi:hypothetical protein
MCARGMPYNASNNSGKHHRVTPEPAVGPASARSCSSDSFEHDLFGKPVSTFPDHARQIKGKQNAARRMSSELHELIVTLKASGQPTRDPERSLQSYVGALKHLEDHERRVRKEDKAIKHETKKSRSKRSRQIRTLRSTN